MSDKFHLRGNCLMGRSVAILNRKGVSSCHSFSPILTSKWVVRLFCILTRAFTPNVVADPNSNYLVAVRKQFIVSKLYVYLYYRKSFRKP